MLFGQLVPHGGSGERDGKYTNKQKLNLKRRSTQEHEGETNKSEGNKANRNTRETKEIQNNGNTKELPRYMKECKEALADKHTMEYKGIHEDTSE